MIRVLIIVIVSLCGGYSESENTHDMGIEMNQNRKEVGNKVWLRN